MLLPLVVFFQIRTLFVLRFIFGALPYYDMTAESRQEVKWDRERYGIGEGPKSGIRTWDAHNKTVLYVRTLAH